MANAHTDKIDMDAVSKEVAEGGAEFDTELASTRKGRYTPNFLAFPLNGFNC